MLKKLPLNKKTEVRANNSCHKIKIYKLFGIWKKVKSRPWKKALNELNRGRPSYDKLQL